MGQVRMIFVISGYVFLGVCQVGISEPNHTKEAVAKALPA